MAAFFKASNPLLIAPAVVGGCSLSGAVVGATGAFSPVGCLITGATSLVGCASTAGVISTGATPCDNCFNLSSSCAITVSTSVVSFPAALKSSLSLPSRTRLSSCTLINGSISLVGCSVLIIGGTLVVEGASTAGASIGAASVTGASVLGTGTVGEVSTAAPSTVGFSLITCSLAFVFSIAFSYKSLTAWISAIFSTSPSVCAAASAASSFAFPSSNS